MIMKLSFCLGLFIAAAKMSLIKRINFALLIQISLLVQIVVRLEILTVLIELRSQKIVEFRESSLVLNQLTSKRYLIDTSKKFRNLSGLSGK